MEICANTGGCSKRAGWSMRSYRLVRFLKTRIGQGRNDKIVHSTAGLKIPHADCLNSGSSYKIYVRSTHEFWASNVRREDLSCQCEMALRLALVPILANPCSLNTLQPNIMSKVQ